VHNIANQPSAGEAPRRQEYPPRVEEMELAVEDGGVRSSHADFTAYSTVKTARFPQGTTQRQRPPETEWHGHNKPTILELSRTHTSNPLNHTTTAPLRLHRTTHTNTTRRYKLYPPTPTPSTAKHPPPQPPQASKQEDFADQPYRGVIHMITGRSSADFDTKRQKRDHYHSVNHVAVTGLFVHTKWPHVPLTFDARDVDLRSAPHIDAMVINCSVAGWDLHKVLVNNGSQADIIFLHAFDRMGISHSLLKPSDNPLYGFGGKGTFPVGKIELPLSFGVAPNARSEQVTFDIVDMVYPYNAIMGRGSINKFEAAIHGLYLCMKIPGPQGAITVYGNQQVAHNIERDFVPGQRNVHCLTAQREVPGSVNSTAKEHEKAQLQSNDGTKTVPLNQATPQQMVTISEDLTSHDEERLLDCLSKNKDVFAWSALDLVGVSRSIIEHGLGIDPSVRPKKQRLRKMSDEKTEAAKAEVHRLLEAKFIEPIAYPTWLANVVMVQKKSGKWRMCIDFTRLNKACPKDNFPLPRIVKIVDSAAGCEVMSLLDCFSGYHQIYMKEEDKASTSFITPFDMYCFIRMPEGLKNVGSTFSRLTKTVLESQVGRNIFTYVDDIVVASRSKEDHLADLAETFANMRTARLRLNPKKCVFGVRQGKILGYLVSHRGIEANPTKIQAIINMTPPQSAREVQRLTGRLAALNRFISKSAERSLPFLKTLRGAKDFAWGPEQAATFASLK
jgi:hypothetical protein